MFVWVCKRRKGREMRWECVCVWACSLALTGVSFPGMNNSNECNGNHAMLVIFFSVACPSAPPPPPTPHITARAGKQAPRAAPCFSYLNCYISALFPVKKEGYQTEREHLSIHRSLVSSQPQHTHTHLACTVCFLAILFSPVCADSARGYTNWSGGVISRWHRSTSSIATFAPAPPSQTSS